VKRSTLTITILATLLILFGGYLVFGGTSGLSAPAANGVSVSLYKSPTCGCCGLYAAYLRSAGFTVDVQEVSDMAVVKEQYGVPGDLQSCHTSVIDGKVVEGHVPVEAVTKLLSQDSVTAISLPGMPSGSPGMPGGKLAPFTIYSFSGSEPVIFTEL